MFDNVGGKIKVLAKVLTGIGIVASIISAISIWSQAGARYAGPSGPYIWTGLLVLILGCLSSWLGSLALYGLGQMIENTDNISYYATRTYEMARLQNNGDSKPKSAPTPAAQKSLAQAGGNPPAHKSKTCPKCGEIASAMYCPICGTRME